jgi:hypothetical protein
MRIIFIKRQISINNSLNYSWMDNKEIVMSLKILSNEELINIYLTAYKQKLNDSFLKILLDEVIERDIYDFLLKTSLKS